MDGVLVIDKPQGLTSHDVVAAARRTLREPRIGHTGTLDPLATGVLPLAVGRATRLVRFLTSSDKDYDAWIVFGRTTDTYDVTGGEVTRTDAAPPQDQVLRAIETLTGEYLQAPPPYSAKKVAGQRAYDLARRNQAVALAPVPVRVARAELVEHAGDRARVTLTCSAGFYVRSFAHALGELVGTGACLEALRRTRSGDFAESAAVPFEQLAQPDLVANRLIPMAALLPALPAVWVTERGRGHVSHGRELTPADYVLKQDAKDGIHGEAAPDAPWVRLLDVTGSLLALARPATGGSLHPSVVLI